MFSGKPAVPPVHSRRRFLGTLGAGALAVGARPALGRPARGARLAPFARTSPKSGLEPIILGSGDHTYECIHDWGRLPRTIAYGNTHGVCEDSQGRIYIKHTVHGSSESSDAMVVFDAEGQFIRSWGAEFRGGAHGLHLSREGSDEFLYLCDPARGLVVKTDLNGRDIWRLGCPMDSGVYNNPGEYHPTNVAVAPGGDVYVADGYGKSWIHQYTRDGAYIRTFGGPGKERGQLSCPHGLMVDTRGPTPILAIADRSNRRIQNFTLDGRSLGVVTDELRSPCHFHTHGTDLLIPDLEARVTIFDKDNRLLVHLGDGESFGLRDKPRDQFVPGKFIAPHSAIFDHAGNILVVEWVEVGRVTRLRRIA